MADPDFVINIRELDAGYGGPAIVRGVDLDIRRGKMITFVGPNGAGKSTLLRAIYGIAKTYGGTITYDDERIDQSSALDRYARGIVFIPQGRCNFGQMSVAENLEIAAHTIPRAEREAAREYVFELFPILQKRFSTLAGNLSGGEQQLLEMGMVLQTRPDCLLVDEPSLGLSPKMQADIFANLADLRDMEMTVIAVEQNVREALAVSDEAAVLVQGEIVMHGPANKVVKDAGMRRAYLGG